MRLRFLGKGGTEGGGCPSLYATDRGTYVVQGWRTGTPGTIEIPHLLLGFALPGTFIGATMTDTGRGTFVLSGTSVTDLEALRQQAEREAFHLEVRDDYYPADYPPLVRFLADEPDDYGWFQPWLSHVRETVRRGVAVHRARVVTVPHNDYTRYAKHVARLNVEAGEDVRYLSRHLIAPTELTTDDWWLFDDSVVAFTVFEPGTNGRWVGGAVTTDPRIVSYMRGVKERVWSLAVPLSEYIDA